jgi:hypothetical protein
MALKKKEQVADCAVECAALKKEVAALKKEVAALKKDLKAKPSGGADSRVDKIWSVLVRMGKEPWLQES